MPGGLEVLPLGCPLASQRLLTCAPPAPASCCSPYCFPCCPQAKCELSPIVSTREISFQLLRPVPLHTSLLLAASVKEVRGIRCYVEGALRAAPADAGAPLDSGAVLATCTALLINVKDFL